MNDQTRPDTSKIDKPQHLSFLLRMWCADKTGCSNWRASLEMPETGKCIGFASLEQLFIFLIDISENRNDTCGENENKE
jgi:hypothetical protein